MKPLIQVCNLGFHFTKGQSILTNINLTFFKNSFTVITGKNGSGKTILMKQLNGLLEPTEGEVLINGISIKKIKREASQIVGFIFQNSNTQIIGQTVRDDIAFGPENMELSKDEIEKRIEYTSKALSLEKLLDKSPHRLSGGEAKKTAIAGILAMKPEIIVFDEPFAGLDYDGVKMLLRILLDLKSRGTSIIVITHDLEKVLAHADHLVVMENGRIIGDGSPVDVLKIAALAGIRIPKNTDIKEMTWLED